MKLLFLIKTYHDSDNFFQKNISIFDNKTYLQINKIFCDYYLNWLSEFYTHFQNEYDANIIFLNTIELLEGIIDERTKEEYFKYLNYLQEEFNPDIIVSNTDDKSFSLKIKSNSCYKILWKSSRCKAQDDIFSNNYFQHIISDNNLILDMSKRRKINNSFLLSSVPDRLLVRDDYSKKKNIIFFSGSLGYDYKWRKEILKYIIKNNIEIEIRSRDLKYFNKYFNRLLNIFRLNNLIKNNEYFYSILKEPIFGQELYNYSRQFKYIFNSHSDFDINNAINLRVFETLSTNCLLFSDKNSKLVDYFQDEKDLVIYTDKNDLIKKIKKYKSDEKLSSWIANNGFEVIKENHTTSKRISAFKKILKI